MGILDRIGLTELVARTEGRSGVLIGLIDGPVSVNHPDFQPGALHEMPSARLAACRRTESIACSHGTFVAGMLSARRGALAPSLCPGCTVLVRPIFSEDLDRDGGEALPNSSPEELACAIIDCVGAGVRLLNLSVTALRTSTAGRRTLIEAIDLAARRGVLVIAAAGNQASLSASPLTAHPWVIPVAAADQNGRPTGATNLGRSIGTFGLLAPGDAVTSLASQGPSQTRSGTSVAVPFVTGTAALLWSEFPSAVATDVKAALVGPPNARRARIVPPLLDVRSAYLALQSANL